MAIDGREVQEDCYDTLDVLAKQSFRTGRLTREDTLVLLENKRLYNYVGQDEFQNVEPMNCPIALQQGIL